MREELDKKLCEKYPEIFRDRHAPITESCLAWGFECGDGWYDIIDALCSQIKNHLWNKRQHLETAAKNIKYREMALAGDWSFLYGRGEKWDKWLEDHVYLEQQKKHYLEPLPEWMTKLEEIPEVVATQVKEKYGTLRFYYNGGDDTIDGMVRMAEAMSSVTCEVCGNPGKVRNGGWISTLCDTHAEERGYGPVSLEENHEKISD